MKSVELRLILILVITYPEAGARPADDLPPIIMLAALLVEPVVTVGPEVTRRCARGEEGGGGRRITDTTLCVCSHIRRKRRILPVIVIITTHLYLWICTPTFLILDNKFYWIIKKIAMPVFLLQKLHI